MGWGDISERERDRLLELYRVRDHQSLTEECIRLGMSYSNLDRRLRDWQSKKRHLLVPFNEDQRPHWQGYLRHTTNDALFISDFEIPDHNEELLYYAHEVQKIYNLNTVVFAGDIMKQDEPGVATHDVEWQYQQPTFADNIITTTSMFQQFDHVPNKFFVSGNHDVHVARNTQGSISFGMFFPQFNIQFSRYSYMYLNTCRGPVKITHPNKKFSENAIDLGRRINFKDAIKAHIVLAHTHQGQRGHSKDGRYEIIALGCMRCPNKTQYKNIDDNTFGEWQPGFAFMKDGFFYMLNLYTTNWKAVLRGNLMA